MKKRLGDLLLENGLITKDQLGAALAHQRQWGLKLGSALVAKGFVTEGTLVQVLSQALKIPALDLALVDVDSRALAAVPARLCEQYDVFPVTLDEQSERGGRNALVLAMADPLNVAAIDEVAFAANATVRPTIAQISSIDQAIRRHYHGQPLTILPLGALAPQQAPSAQTAPAAGATAPQAAPRHDPFMDFSDDFSAPIPRVPDARPGDAGAEATLLTGTVVPLMGNEPLDALQRNFWALMRVLDGRGLIDKEELLRELEDAPRRMPTRSG